MQKRFNPSEAATLEIVQPTGQFIDVDHVLQAARRQWPIALLVASVTVALASVYLLTSVPRYTASVSMMMDASNQHLVAQLSDSGGAVDDETSILSQVEVLKSDAITALVVDKLKLTQDPQFNAPRRSLLSNIGSVLVNIGDLSRLFGKADVAAEDEKLAAQMSLSAGLVVTRVGKTFVLQISYTSFSPQLSASVAQAFADAYLADQLDSKYAATQRASSWMQDRIAELRQRSLDSDLAVQKFKSDHNLIETNGVLLTDQQLQQTNTQLIAARGITAEAQAKYDSVEAMIKSGNVDAVVADALDSPVITDIRAKYLDASGHEEDIAHRLGSDHEQAVLLRAQMAQYQQQMFAELGRIADSYATALDIANARQRDLESQVTQATGVSATANDSQVQLRELERESDTYKTLYATFLQRYQEAIQQQTFPVTEARIISNAQLPRKPSSPNIPLVLGLAGVIGVLAGGVVGGVREFRDRYFRTGEQVRADTGLEFLGFMPRVRDGWLPRQRKKKELPANAITKSRRITNLVLDQPRSPFAETLRGVKLAADLRLPSTRPKVIGVVSSLPEEGKTVIAVNLAELLAHQGARTLLIDADLRNPSATKLLSAGSDSGLVDVLSAGMSIREVIRTNPETGMDFLPAPRPAPFSAELLTSPRMDEVLRQADYEYVVVDLPPLGPVVDARAMSVKIDAFLFVVEWGRTNRKIVQDTLQREWMISEKIVGAILTKVDTKRMRLYEPSEWSGNYAGRYAYYSAH